MGSIEEHLRRNLLLPVQRHHHVGPGQSAREDREIRGHRHLEGERVIVCAGAADPDRMSICAVEDAVRPVNGGSLASGTRWARLDRTRLDVVLCLRGTKRGLRGQQLGVQHPQPLAGQRAASRQSSIEVKVAVDLSPGRERGIQRDLDLPGASLGPLGEPHRARAAGNLAQVVAEELAQAPVLLGFRVTSSFGAHLVPRPEKPLHPGSQRLQARPAGRSTMGRLLLRAEERLRGAAEGEPLVSR
jgi:hypothetical protein